MRNANIQEDSTILLRTPRGDIRCAKIEKDSLINLGRHGSFYANELIGRPYGLTYEIVDRRLSAIAPRTFQEIEDTDATNELINDSQFVQPLSLSEIEELKRSGAHASDIIQKQIEQHAAFSLKTEYSKEKYKKRKQDKYSKTFTTIEPTLFNVCGYWFNKDRERIRDIRMDTLAQILNLSNIRPGGRYLVVDDASGLVVSGVLDKMGGFGRLISICDVDGPPAYPIVHQMNFKKEMVSTVLRSLNWSTARKNYIPVFALSEPSSTEIKTERHRSRINRRKAFNDMLQRTREELFAGEFEALVVSSIYEPFSIVQMLSPHLAGSASIVVQSPHVQVLADLQSKMRQLPCYLAPSVTEAWLRQYQVLPGRTHPLMSTSGSGGYLLQAFYVYHDPSASSVTYYRHSSSKKQKLLSNDDTSSPVAIMEDTWDKDLSNSRASTCGESPMSIDEQ